MTDCHFALDLHEIIFANSAPAETVFLPDADSDVVTSADLVWESAHSPIPVHPHTARISLRQLEARLLVAAMQSATLSFTEAA